MNKHYIIFGAMLVLLALPFASAATGSNIGFWWHLDNTTTANSDKNGSYDILGFDSITSSAGILGNGAESNDRLDDVSAPHSIVDDFLDGGADFTFNFWYNPILVGTPASDDQGVFGAWDGEGFFLRHDDTPFTVDAYKGGTCNAVSLGNLPENTWNMVSIAYDGTNLRMYINGTLDTTAACSNAGSMGATTLFYLFQNPANHAVNGIIDEFMIYDANKTAADLLELYNSGDGCSYENALADNCVAVPAGQTYATVVVKDEFDNATIAGLTVFIGTDSNVTDGSGIATVYNFTGLNYTVDGGVNYFNGTGTATENASVTSYIYGAYVALEAYNVLGTQITTFNVSSGAFSNTTTTGTAYLLLSPNASHNVVFSAADYLNKTQIVGTHGQDTDTYNTTGLYQTVINLTGKSRVDNSSINVFTINYTGVNGDVVNGTLSTTTGNVTLFNMLGNYSLIFDNSSFELGYYNFSATSAAEAYEFYLYTSNSINFSFFDEETGDLIDNTTVYLELISTAQSGNYSTTTGSLYEDLLSPDAYTLRYNALGYEDSFYYFTLVDRTFNALNLTLLNSSSSTSVTLTVYDTLGNKLEAATIKVLKYDVTTNTYNIVEILNTNFEGVAVANIVLNSEYYKFIIDYTGETRLTTTPTYIYGTSLTFYIPTGASGMADYFNEAEISGTLTFNYNTSLATFTYSDLDNTATQGCLYAYTSSLGSNTLVNTSCSSSSSGSLNLVIFNSSTTWFLEGVVTKGGDAHVLSTYRVDFVTRLNESGSGAFFAFLLLATIVFIGLFSLEVAVVIASIVPLLFTVTKLADFDYIISIPILLLGLVTAFIIGSNKK